MPTIYYLLLVFNKAIAFWTALHHLYNINRTLEQMFEKQLERSTMYSASNVTSKSKALVEYFQSCILL